MNGKYKMDHKECTPITKNALLPLTTSFFENLIEYKDLIQIVDLIYQLRKCKYSYSFVSTSVLFEVVFSLRVSLSLFTQSFNFVFYLVFFSRSFTNHRTAEGRGRAFL